MADHSEKRKKKKKERKADFTAKCVSLLYHFNLVTRWRFFLQSNTRNPDPSRKMDLDFWGLLLKRKIFTVKILKFGTPQTIAIIVLKIENFDVTLH